MLALESFDSALTLDNFDEFTEVVQGKEETFVTHRALHPEEARSIDYTVEFGDEEALDQMRMRDGKIYCGVSPLGERSPVDEHAWFQGDTYVPRRPNESCISLTARLLKTKDRASGKVLPITSFPAIQREVDYLHRTDLEVNEDDPHHLESFQSAVKAMHALRPNEPTFVRRWLREGMNVKRDCAFQSANFTFTNTYFLMAHVTEFARRGRQWRKEWLEAGIEAIEYTQRQFFSAKDALRARMEDQSVLLKSPAGEKIRFGWVESDNERIGSAARHIGCHILLQCNSDGHMQVYTDYRVHGGKGIDLGNVAYRLQLAEQEAQVQQGWLEKIIMDDRELLTREGFPFWGAIWYYIYGMLLNGSLTRPAVPPSCLSPMGLYLLIQEALFEVGYRPITE